MRRLEATGQLDFVDISAGTDSDLMSLAEHIPSMYFPPANLVHFAAAIKPVTRLPVFCAGAIRDPAVAEGIVASGQADMVGMTRAHIADPHVVLKLRDGPGRGHPPVHRLHAGLPGGARQRPADRVRVQPGHGARRGVGHARAGPAATARGGRGRRPGGSRGGAGRRAPRSPRGAPRGGGAARRPASPGGEAPEARELPGDRELPLAADGEARRRGAARPPRRRRRGPGGASGRGRGGDRQPSRAPGRPARRPGAARARDRRRERRGPRG